MKQSEEGFSGVGWGDGVRGDRDVTAPLNLH